MTKKVLVTGAGGFIVEEALRRGYDVWAAVRATTSREFLKDSRINFVELDFTDGDKFKSAIEAHHGVFLTQSNGASVSSLVKEIESRRNHENESSNKAAMVDAPGWWTLALAIVLMVWLALAWRLRR